MKATDKKESVRQAVERILDNYLETNKHRKTPERYAILNAVYSMEGHFTLDELGDKLSADVRFPVSRATLYNTLRLFLELRLVIRHRFQGTTKYEACYEGESHCHQICTVCGKVTEVRSPEVTATIDQMHLKRFRKDGYTLYIYGICSTCQAAITRQKRNKNKPDKKDNEQRKG
jgi:Fur family ferric uptake transcriptional regulator